MACSPGHLKQKLEPEIRGQKCIALGNFGRFVLPKIDAFLRIWNSHYSSVLHFLKSINWE